MNKRALSLLAVVTLAFASLAAAPPATAASSSGSAYVAFGDSEAAGTGNFLYVDQTCLRSRVSYPLILGATSYACAGATTGGVTGQVAAAVAAGTLGANTKRVTLTAGVNDLGWVAVLQTCYTLGDVACQGAVNGAVGALPGVGAGIGADIAAIRTAAPNAKILVTGYPRLFGAVSTSCTIGWYAGAKVVVTALQAGLANGGVDALNTTIAGAVGAVGDPAAKYVDLTSTFAGHSLCDTNSSWIAGVIGIPLLADRALHIDARGQFAVAGLIARS